MKMGTKTAKIALCAVLAMTLKSDHLMAHNSPEPHVNMNKISDGQSVANVEQALQEALNTNPDVLFQKAEREATRYKIDQAVGNNLPSITLRAGIGRERVDQAFETFQPSGGGGATGNLSAFTRQTGTQNRFDPSIRLTQRLFDGAETRNDIKMAKNEFEQSTRNVAEAQVLVAFTVIEAYIAVRRFERLYRLAQENIRVHQSILSKMKKLVEAGKAASGDEESVRSRLFDAKAALGDIEGDLLTAYANFKEVVGAEAKNLEIPKLAETDVPKTLEDAVKMARAQNKSVLVARATENVSKSDFDKTIAPFMPRVDLELEARRNVNVAGKLGRENILVGQVVSTFNVFNGGKDVGRRRELRARLAGAKFRTVREVRRAEKETRVSYAEMVSARKQSVALRSAVGSKQKVRDGYMKQFEAGSRSFVDILDASHEYFLAKGSLITADATGDLAIARLRASMGDLLTLYKTLNVGKDMKQLGTHEFQPAERGQTVYHTAAKAEDSKMVTVAANTGANYKDLDHKDRAFAANVSNVKTSAPQAVKTAEAKQGSVNAYTRSKEQVFMY